MKIPTFVLIYFDSEIIQKSLNFLIKNPMLEIHVIENKSITTSVNREKILKLLEEKKIASYMLMEKNISNNAFELILTDHLHLITAHPYVMITDGDLEIDDEHWLEEQLSILEKNRSLFLCAVPLMLDNLPLKAFPSAKDWIPSAISEEETYSEQLTGIHLCLLRSIEFISCLQYIKRAGLSFQDSHMHTYCYQMINKKWSCCKKAKARHLTWDAYADLNHPYTKAKCAKSFKSTWNHTEFCSYTKYTYANGSVRECFVRKYAQLERLKKYYHKSTEYYRKILC